MERSFKHPQIFADMLMFCQIYYPIHNNFPKPFRYAVGERILAESAEGMRAIVLANAVNKQSPDGRHQGAAHVRQVRAALEVIRGFLLMAWKLKFLSHRGLTTLSEKLESMSKQAARWEQWFEGA
jgi:hypothetical protein